MPTDKTTRIRLTDKARLEVWAILGHECALRGVDGLECDGPMTVDHPFGRDYKSSKITAYNRWRRYLKEAKQGLIRPLCKAHNDSFRPQRGRTLADDVMQPF